MSKDELPSLAGIERNHAEYFNATVSYFTSVINNARKILNDHTRVFIWGDLLEDTDKEITERLNKFRSPYRH